MDKLLSKEALDLFFMFGVPGFIAQRVYSLLVAGQEQKTTDRAVEILTFSLIHVALFSWLYGLVEGITHPVLLHLAQVGVAALLPAIEALVLVRALKARWLRARLNMVHPTPKAWDHVFGMGKPFWVVLTLKSGSKIGGYYGPNSFASSFPNPEQIYIEQVWKLSEAGEFLTPIERSGGAIIPFTDCQFIEFFEAKEAQHVGQEQLAEAERRLPAGQEGLPAVGAVPAVVATEGR